MAACCRPTGLSSTATSTASLLEAASAIAKARNIFRPARCASAWCTATAPWRTSTAFSTSTQQRLTSTHSLAIRAQGTPAAEMPTTREAVDLRTPPGIPMRCFRSSKAPGLGSPHRSTSSWNPVQPIASVPRETVPTSGKRSFPCPQRNGRSPTSRGPIQRQAMPWPARLCCHPFPTGTRIPGPSPPGAGR